MVFEDYDQNYNYYLFNRLTHQTMNLYWSDPLYYLSIGWLSIPNGNEPRQQSVGQLKYYEGITTRLRGNPAREFRRAPTISSASRIRVNPGKFRRPWGDGQVRSTVWHVPNAQIDLSYSRSRRTAHPAYSSQVADALI